MKRFALALLILFASTILLAQYFPPSGGGGGAGTSNGLCAPRQSGAVSTTSIVTPISVVNGDYMLVGVASNTAYPTIADGTNTYTLIVRNTNGSGNFGQLYFVKVNATAALTITATGGTAVNLAFIDLIPPSGFTGTVDATNTNTGGLSTTLTTTHSNEVVITAVAMNHGSTVLGNLFPMHLAATSVATDGIAIGCSGIATPAATLAGFSLLSVSTVSDAVTAAGSLF